MSKLFNYTELQNEHARRDFLEYRKIISPKLKYSWFHEEVCNALEDFYEQLIANQKPVLIITTPPQHGKELADSTPILTTRGWKKHGELKAGDYVFHPFGHKVIINKIIEQDQDCDVLVTLTDGSKFKCHRNHEWTLIHKRAKTVTIETRGLIEKELWEGKQGKRGSRAVYQIPPTECLNICNGNLLIDPYVLGAWLGDGTLTNPCFTHSPDDSIIIDEIERAGYKKSKIWKHKDTGVLTSSFPGKFKQDLIDEGLFKNRKYIPEKYILSSKDQRLRLLAGLIDTDGSLHKKTGQYRFINTNKELIDNTCILLRTLGYTYSITAAQPRKAPNSYGIQDKKVCYQIGFTPLDQIPCVLDRKKSDKIPMRRKVAIESVRWLEEHEKEPGKCIEVNSPDGLYLAGKNLHATHNSRAVIDFTSWISGKLPDLETFYTAFSDRLGIRANLRLQRTYDSERYQQIFPELQIANPKNKDSKGYTRNRNLLEYVGREGLFRNTTINGSITGETIGLGIIDDPIKGRKEASSLTVRDSSWFWLTDDFFTRFSENAGLLMTLTRWHIDDPAGRLKLEMPGVRVLNFPAIAEKGIPDSGAKHRSFGQVLFPEHKSKEFLMKRKALMINPNWLSLYQGQPIQAGGGLIKVENLKIVSHCPEIDRSVRYWDKAGTEGGGAFTAGVKVAKLKDGKFIILDIVKGQWSAMRREKRIMQTAKMDKIGVIIGIEQEPGSGGLESAESTIRMLSGYNCYADKVTDSKDIRADPFAAQVEAGNILLLEAEWNKDFIAEAETFPDGKFKDEIDAAVGAFQKLAGVPELGFTDEDMNEIKTHEKDTTSPGIGDKAW